MNLRQFKKDNKKKQTIIIMGISIFLLIIALLICRTYAIYTEKENLNMMKGLVPNQDYDVMVSFVEIDAEGNKKIVDNIPEGKNWNIEINCNNDANVSWNYKTWKIEMDILKTRTKCKLTFYPYNPPLGDYGIQERLVENGSGLYEVPHESANITSNLNEVQKQNLQKTEYRYAGHYPDNYVTFNGEYAEWRIIGLVNTPEGPRLKLMRNDGIGTYSWDSSTITINYGRGINEWSQADIMTIMNNGPYYNRTSGNCSSGANNATTTCDFSSIGLTSEAKNMIDTITWNVGSMNEDETKTLNVASYYEKERSNNSGKICKSGSDCNDTITRNTLWKGKVGLIYPSDYGYATSGGTNITRNECLSSNESAWKQSANTTPCAINNWISTHWTITPIQNDSLAHLVYYFSSTGTQQYTFASFALYVAPTIYLKTNVKVASGLGTQKDPYILSII